MSKHTWKKPHTCPTCGSIHQLPQAECGKCYYRRHNPKSERTLRREAGLCARCGLKTRTHGSYCQDCDRSLNYIALDINVNSRTQNVNRLAAMRGATDKLSVTEMRQLFDGIKLCSYCGEQLDKECQVDHKTPLSRGGLNVLSNLEVICKRCNQMKSDMTREEFIGRIRQILNGR